MLLLRRNATIAKDLMLIQKNKTPECTAGRKRASSRGRGQSAYGHTSRQANPPGGLDRLSVLPAHYEDAHHEGGRYPTNVRDEFSCPIVRTELSMLTTGRCTCRLAGVVCCLICLPLACLPCVAGWCENTHVFCTRCGKKVATIPHDGPIQVESMSQQAVLVPSKYVSQPSMK